MTTHSSDEFDSACYVYNSSLGEAISSVLAVVAKEKIGALGLAILGMSKQQHALTSEKF